MENLNNHLQNGWFSISMLGYQTVSRTKLKNQTNKSLWTPMVLKLKHAFQKHWWTKGIAPPNLFSKPPVLNSGPSGRKSWAQGHRWNWASCGFNYGFRWFNHVSFGCHTKAAKVISQIDGRPSAIAVCLCSFACRLPCRLFLLNLCASATNQREAAFGPTARLADLCSRCHPQILQEQPTSLFQSFHQMNV